MEMIKNGMSALRAKIRGVDTARLALMSVPVLALAAVGAFNGGTAPTTGVWTVIVTTMTSILQSDFAIGLALVGLLAAVWAVSTGKGFGGLMVVIGVLALAYVGPGVLQTMATALPDAVAQAQGIAPAVFQR